MFSYALLTGGKDGNNFRVSCLTFQGNIRVLADPTWDGADPGDADFLESVMNEVELVVLSQSTPQYVSGFALMCYKYPALMAKISIYATVAVSQLARVSTVEFYRSIGMLGPLQAATMEVSDIDEWFDRITGVKYQQNVPVLDGRLLLIAYNSGHTLGGTIWLISSKTDKIIYAPAWNHAKDSFLNNAGFVSSASGNPITPLIRASALITGTDLGSSIPHRKRIEKFLDLVNATLANGGAVVLPTTTTGRFFELLRVIDEHLSALQGAAIPVYFLSYSGTKVLSYTTNLVDWMSSQLIKESEGIGAEDRAYSRLPFDPSKVDLLQDALELVKLSGPKIVFASGYEMRDGDPSLDVLRVLGHDEKTTIILTEHAACNSKTNISSKLYDEWLRQAVAKGGGHAEDGTPVPFEDSFHFDQWSEEVPLTGSEVSAFVNHVSLQRKQKMLSRALEKKNENLLNAGASSDELSSDEEDASGDELPVEEQAKYSVEFASSAKQLDTKQQVAAQVVLVSDYISESLDAKKPIDIRLTTGLRSKQAMFPFATREKRRKIDDYGEVIEAGNFAKNNEASSNTKLIDHDQRKFEIRGKDEWGFQGPNIESSSNNRHFREEKLSKVTPQEALNNQVIKRNLDTLFRPVRRSKLGDTKTSELRMRCGLSYIDLMGLADLRSFGIIVSMLKPEHVILLPCLGNIRDKNAQDNQAIVRDSLMGHMISKRKTKQEDSTNGEINNMEISKESSGPISAEPNRAIQLSIHGKRAHQFELKIHKSLDEKLVWQRLDRFHRIAPIQGEIQLLETASINNRSEDPIGAASRMIVTHSEEKADILLNETRDVPFAIGNVSLPELKKKLNELKLEAEFKGEGTLVVNDQVVIRKSKSTDALDNSSGNVIIEGQVGPLIYKIRNCVKDLLAFL